MSKPKTKTFIIKFDIPPGAQLDDALDYIEDALGSARGALHPDNPMSKFDRDSLKVYPGPPKGK